MMMIRKRTFWQVTKRNLKSNLECAFCKRVDCPLRYRAEKREDYACKEEIRKREERLFGK